MKSLQTFFIVVMLMTLLGGCVVAAPEPAEAPAAVEESAVAEQPEEFDWQRYAGQEIRVVLIQNAWSDSIKPLIPEFEELTGIEVNEEILPEDQAWDKLRVEMQAENEDLDVFFNQTNRFGREFTDNGWYEPLGKYIEDSSMTAPDWEWEDFAKPTKDMVIFDDQIIALPLDRATGPVLAYRKDILEELGISVPTTLEELEQAVAQADAETPEDVYGIVMRGKGAQTTSQFVRILNEYGGRWEDEEGNITINTPEAIEAFKWWGEMLRNYGPPGAASYAWPDVHSVFLGGNAVFTLEDGINAGRISDPEKSVVGGKVGYAVIPQGPGGIEARSQDPCVLPYMFAVSISSFSENKEAAWYFMQYMTSEDAQVDYLIVGRPAARDSAWEAARFQEWSSEHEPDYWKTLAEASSVVCYATPQFAPPSIKDQGQARDIIGQVVVASILGEDVEAAAEVAQQELEALMARQ